jgi:predicted ester cyclase
MLDVAMRNTKHNTILSISYLRETLKNDFFNIMKQKGVLMSSPLNGRHVFFNIMYLMGIEGQPTFVK